MGLPSENKVQIINEYKRSESDTGSIEVQVALLSERIKSLTEHFKLHTRDQHSRQGLLRMVNRRRKLLDYVKKHDKQRYSILIEKLGLRR